jgi:hypothetical protein
MWDGQLVFCMRPAAAAAAAAVLCRAAAVWPPRVWQDPRGVSSSSSNRGKTDSRQGEQLLLLLLLWIEGARRTFLRPCIWPHPSCFHCQFIALPVLCLSLQSQVPLHPSVVYLVTSVHVSLTDRCIGLLPSRYATLALPLVLDSSPVAAAACWVHQYPTPFHPPCTRIPPPPTPPGP